MKSPNELPRKISFNLEFPDTDVIQSPIVHALYKSSLVSITDCEGNIVYANDLFCKASGYLRSQLLKKNLKFLHAACQPEAFFDEIWKTVSSGEIWKGEIQYKAKDGSMFWLQTIISPIHNAEGKTIQWVHISTDITEKKQMELELLRYKEFSRGILSALGSHIAVVSGDGEILMVNKSWMEFFSLCQPGRIQAFGEGDNFFESIAPEFYGGNGFYAQAMDGIQAVREKRLGHFELVFPLRVGLEERWYVLRAKLFEAERKLLVLAHQDVTRLVRAREDLEKSEARLMEAQGIASIGNWEYQFLHKRLWCSREISRIFEIPLHEQEPTFELFLAQVHKEDREVVGKVFLGSLKGRMDFNITFRCLMPAGKLKYLHAQCRTFFNENRLPERSHGTLQDITQRVQAEMQLENQKLRYKNVVENISDGLIIDDVEGNVIYANLRFLEMFGFTRADLDGLKLEGFVAPEYLPGLKERHNRRIKGEKVSETFEFMGLCKDGTRKWFEGRVVKIVENGKIVGTQSAIRDIHKEKTTIEELKSAESEKTRLLDELTRKFNELMQFNYIVSHNLRAPLASIIGLSNVLALPDTENNEKDAIVQNIRESTLKMDELIRDLNLILSSRHVMNEKKEKVELLSLVETIKGTLETQLREAGCSFMVQLAPGADTLFSVKSYLNSILFNLVSNAIKYRSASTPPNIKLATSLEGGKICISVSDNGLGIDMDKHGEYLFGLYKRFHYQVEGKGLGLNMAKTQVEALGGEITVESKPDKGSTFTVKLPLN